MTLERNIAKIFNLTDDNWASKFVMGERVYLIPDKINVIKTGVLLNSLSNHENVFFVFLI